MNRSLITSVVVVVVVVQLLSHVWLFATPWTAACQASLSFTISQSLLKLMSMESVMSFNHLILCRPLLLLPSIFAIIRVFSNESVFTSGGTHAQSSPTLTTPWTSVPGSSVHGIFQARILVWVTIFFSRGSSQPRDQTCISWHLPHWQAGSLPLCHQKQGGRKP